MEIIAIIATIFVGFFTSSTIGAVLNWHDAGAIFSIAVMGGIILWKINHQDQK